MTDAEKALLLVVAEAGETVLHMGARLLRNAPAQDPEGTAEADYSPVLAAGLTGLADQLRAARRAVLAEEVPEAARPESAPQG